MTVQGRSRNPVARPEPVAPAHDSRLWMGAVAISRGHILEPAIMVPCFAADQLGCARLNKTGPMTRARLRGNRGYGPIDPPSRGDPDTAQDSFDHL